MQQYGLLVRVSQHSLSQFLIDAGHGAHSHPCRVTVTDAPGMRAPLESVITTTSLVSSDS
jgi:hypothetical protein